MYNFVTLCSTFQYFAILCFCLFYVLWHCWGNLKQYQTLGAKSWKRHLMNHLITNMVLRDASASKKVTEKWKWDNKYDDIFSMVTAKTSSSEMHPLFLSFSGQTCGVLWLLKSVIFQTLSLWLHLSDHWNYVSFLLPPKHQSCSYKSFWRWKNYTLKTRFV